jgi:hypothetical protein
MEKFDITIKKGKQELVFGVKDYPHHEDEKCKFEIFKDDKLVLSLDPDPHETLTVCKNPGNLDNELVHLIADKLEAYQM